MPKVYVPEGYEAPKTVLDALKCGRAILSQEGRWAQGSEFDTDTPVSNPDPFCGSWTACAIGAIAMCTMGVDVRNGHHYNSASGEQSPVQYWATVVAPAGSPERQLYQAAVDALDLATAQATTYTLYETDPEPWDCEYDNVVDKNDADGTTQAEMLGIFDLAIDKEVNK